MKNKMIALVLAFPIFILKAQSNTNNTIMADTMRNNGKIYVVIAVVLTILAGLILYVFNLDKKISKLEKNN